MPVIEESIVISRPAVEVFEFLTEPENVLLYSSNVVEYEQVSGAPRDVGGVARGTARVAGRRLSFTTELVEVEPARLASSRSSDASIPFRLELRFDEVPEGTRVTWLQETDELGGFFGKLGDAVVVKVSPGTSGPTWPTPRRFSRPSSALESGGARASISGDRRNTSRP